MLCMVDCLPRIHGPVAPAGVGHSVITRRGLFGLLGGAAAVAATGELWTPTKTIFLPPRGGWHSDVIGMDMVREVVHYNIRRDAYFALFDVRTVDNMQHRFDVQLGGLSVGNEERKLALAVLTEHLRFNEIQRSSLVPAVVWTHS